MTVCKYKCLQRNCVFLYHCLSKGWLLDAGYATVKYLAADDESRNVKGWLQKLYTNCFQVDLVTPVASSDTLLCIHATAEEYEATAEDAFIPFQVRTLQSQLLQSKCRQSGMQECVNLLKVEKHGLKPA